MIGHVHECLWVDWKPWSYPKTNRNEHLHTKPMDICTIPGPINKPSRDSDSSWCPNKLASINGCVHKCWPVRKCVGQKWSILENKVAWSHLVSTVWTTHKYIYIYTYIHIIYIHMYTHMCIYILSSCFEGPLIKIRIVIPNRTNKNSEKNRWPLQKIRPRCAGVFVKSKSSARPTRPFTLTAWQEMGIHPQWSPWCHGWFNMWLTEKWSLIHWYIYINIYIYTLDIVWYMMMVGLYIYISLMILDDL